MREVRGRTRVHGGQRRYIAALGVSGVLAAMLCRSEAGVAATAVEAAPDQDGVAVVIAGWERNTDAAAFTKFLVDVWGMSSANILDLADPTVAEMTRIFGDGGGRKGRLHEFLSGASGEKRHMVVYHARQRTLDAGEGRWPVLTEAEPPNVDEAYPLDRLYSSLESLPAKSVTVFADACPTDYDPEGVATPEPQVDPSPDLPSTWGGGMTAVVAACGSTLTSWRPAISGYSAFTYHLLTGLYGEADGDGSGWVTADEVRRYLDLRLAVDLGTAYMEPPAVGLSGDASRILAPKTVRSPDLALDSRPMPWPRLGLQPLVVSTYPESARVRIVAMGPITHDAGARLWLLTVDQEYRNGYQSGMKLPPGAYRIEVTVPGYETVEETVYHGWEETEHHVVLRQVARAWTHATRFHDCEHCPRMAVFQPSSFRMSCASAAGCGDPGTTGDVVIERPFALSGRVTAGQWRACVSAGGCHGYMPVFEGYLQGGVSVVKVSWRDAQAYLTWLSQETGKSYRLPTEAEWVYAAGASAGGRVSGLPDRRDTVWEWLVDCSSEDPERPSDGSARLDSDCGWRVLRGGGGPNSSAGSRNRLPEDTRGFFTGFRVAMSIGSLTARSTPDGQAAVVERVSAPEHKGETR